MASEPDRSVFVEPLPARPNLEMQQKRAKEQRKMLEALKSGDEVVTSGGVVGKVDKVAGDLVFVEVANNVKLRVLKAQISGPYRPVEEKAPAAAEEKKS